MPIHDTRGDISSSSRSTGRWEPGGRTTEKGRGEGDLRDRLSRKIRSQAGQLADLTERLQQQEAYSRLVKTRLLELDPRHSLPVSPQHFHGGVVDFSSRHRKLSTTAVGVGRQREEDGQQQQLQDTEEMRRGYQAAQERLKDAAQLIRQLREALTTRFVSNLFCWSLQEEMCRR